MTQIISKTQVPAKRGGRLDPIAFFERFGVLIFMILLLIFFQLQNSNFLSERNIFNILTEVSIYGIMAVGMTFVILTAGIDLSVGSILAVCAMTAAYVIKGDNFTTVDPNELADWPWDLYGYGDRDWFPAWPRCDPPASAAVYRHPRWDDYLARPDAGD